MLALLGCGLAHANPALLVFGDSLSAAYGIGQQAGWVALLQERLRQKRLDYTVINASVSGETTSGGAARITAALAAHQPSVVVVALGANDGLRGLPLAQMRDNLAVILRAAQKSGSRVLLAGMKMPPNYGPQYTQDFAQAYVRSLASSNARWCHFCSTAWPAGANYSWRIICIPTRRPSRSSSKTFEATRADAEIIVTRGKDRPPAIPRFSTPGNRLQDGAL